MKHLLGILAALSALTLQLLAADVVVNSPADVLVDGQPAGAVADTIRNRPELTSDIQRALVKWAAGEALKLKAAEDKLAAALARRKELVTKAKAAFAALAPEAQEALKAVLVAAEQPEVDARRAALKAELAEKQKELDALK
jgi:glycyl-tRNA synthetase beta subunit